MLKKFKKQMKNEKGLTLIELLAVIVILAIVAAIAIPAIGGIIENSKYNAVKADALNVINAAQLYYLDDTNGKTDVTVKKLVDEKYMDNSGKIPGTATVTRVMPHALTGTGAIDYSNGKNVTFTGATITGINRDENKGSGAGGYTIGAGTP